MSLDRVVFAGYLLESGLFVGLWNIPPSEIPPGDPLTADDGITALTADDGVTALTVDS